MNRLTLLGLLAASILTAAPLRVVPDSLTGDPADGVTGRIDGAAVTFTIRPTGADSWVQWRFAEPLESAGRHRLVLEARGIESTGVSLCVSRLVVLDERGRQAVAYEPDILLTPTWNLRELLLTAFPQPLPAKVGGLLLSLWAPREVGREFQVSLRRAELQTHADVATELAAARVARRRAPRPVTRREATRPEDQRWTGFGPGGGGWYRTIAVSPHDGTVFVGADVGGVYRSRDGCRTWSMVNAGLAHRYVNTIACDPRRPGVVYAGTNGGPARSTDGGETWQMLRAGLPPLRTFGISAPVASFWFSATTPGRVLAGIGQERDYGRLQPATVGGQVAVSDNGGDTWRLVPLPAGEPGPTLSVLCLTSHPAEPATVYAVTPGGLFRSPDAGVTWARRGELAGYQPCFLAPRADQPGSFLLSYHQGPGNRGGVLRSRDGGRTWHEANEGLLARRDVWRLLPHPSEPATFYVGYHRAGGLFVTRDGGDHWSLMNPTQSIQSAWFFVGDNVTGLAIDPRDPRRLLYCNDMEIYQTTDGGGVWEQVCCDLVTPPTADQPATWRGRGCEVLCVNGPQSIAVDPARPRTLYFGYWDAHAWRSDDGGATCYRLTNGLHSGYGRMGCVLLDPADPDVVWLSLGANYDEQRLYCSTDGGRQFRLVGHPAGGLPAGGIFSLALDPNSPLESRTLYACDKPYGVFRSTDGGLTWTAWSNGLPADSRAPEQLAVDPTDPRRLYLAAGAHYHADTKRRVPGYLARSLDGGEHWQIVKDRVEAQCVLIDPTDPRRVYAGNRNFSGVDYPNALYRSTDGGDTWTAVPQDAFAAGPGSRDGDQGWRIFISGLVADPTTPGLLYASCTEHGYDQSNGRGVFRSTDHGATWRPLTLDGLANPAVGTLTIDPVNPARLYVGTGGNGLFRLGPEAEE